jgi:hypothetical protein
LKIPNLIENPQHHCKETAGSEKAKKQLVSIFLISEQLLLPVNQAINDQPLDSVDGKL